MRILMTQARLPAIGAVLAGAIWLAACSSQPPTGNTVPASTTSPATATSAVSPASTSPSPSPTGAENLLLTDAIRAQLVEAAARLNGLPASAYLGLVHGESYYGFDPVTNSYWAGGALDPSPSSQRAQVSVQDDGGYYVFEEPAVPGPRPLRAWPGSTAPRAQSTSRPRWWPCGTGRRPPVTPPGSDRPGARRPGSRDHLREHGSHDARGARRRGEGERFRLAVRWDPGESFVYECGRGRGRPPGQRSRR